MIDAFRILTLNMESEKNKEMLFRCQVNWDANMIKPLIKLDEYQGATS